MIAVIIRCCEPPCLWGWRSQGGQAFHGKDDPMDSQFDPSSQIQRLAVGPRDETVLEQREITVQSYQSSVPFDIEAIKSGLEGAWLSPKTRFGVFSRLPVASGNSATVVLGLQDDLSIRTYDYDQRRPLWFSWQNVVVDTVGVHYFADEHGLLQFTATGGGRRISDDLLHEFNATFLGVPKGSVTKRHFDLEKLRALCFDRFVDRLYMLRFTGPSGDEYQSIDHALFQSRKYIDPKAERLKEIRSDSAATIESFDSDVELVDPILASPLHVRFFIRGLSGSLRLRFPKIRFKKEPERPEDQARVLYQLVDTAVKAILNADYYTNQPRTLDELDVELGMFPEMVDLTPFRDVLANPDARYEFLGNADFGDTWHAWQPHLRAIDELAEADGVASHCIDVVRELAIASPQRVRSLLDACRNDARVTRLGELVASVCWETLQSIAADSRADIESSVLEWALSAPATRWHVDTVQGIAYAGRLPLNFDDLSLERIAEVLATLLNALHAQLLESTGNSAGLLDQLQWCVEAISAYSPSQIGLPAPLRLVAAGTVPTTLAASARVLKEPAESFEQLDDALFKQFGLPSWPHLFATRSAGEVIIKNKGIGAALAVTAEPSEMLFVSDSADARDIPPGGRFSVTLPDKCESVSIRFRKFGADHCATVAIHGAIAKSRETLKVSEPATPIVRKRVERQRSCRQEIDPEGVVVGDSPGLMALFEEIAVANRLGEIAPVLILGEPGVGKTHIARLIHESGQRSAGPFVAVNAGGAGGDLNIQRGEWIGYSRGHGITGVDAKGKPGHIVRADAGTLFVDEFETLSPDLQAIFLSVLEGRSAEMVGGASVAPSVRCVFATNADVDAEVVAGTLRRDLLDRIVVTLSVPPLRDRRGDVLRLSRHLLPAVNMHDRCLLALLRYEWPGNIRELKSTLERARAKAEIDEAAQVLIEHFDLPVSVTEAVQQIADNDCRRELWHCADAIARAEGFEPGTGLQKRAGEILGVKEAQASKMYQAFGLAAAGVA